jgi:hypothetical protein
VPDAMSTAEHFIMAAVICAALVVMVFLLFLAAHQSDRPRLPADHSPGHSDRDLQPLDRGRQAESTGGSGPPYGHHGGGTATA